MKIIKNIALWLVAIPILVLSSINGIEFFHLYMTRADKILNDNLILKQ
jgi:hypothetical protein